MKIFIFKNLKTLLINTLVIYLTLSYVNSQFYSELWKKNINEDVIKFIENKEHTLVFSSNGLVSKLDKTKGIEVSSKLLNHELNKQNYYISSNEKCKFRIIFKFIIINY